MTDVHDWKTRQRNMRAIGPSNTKPELLIAKLFSQLELDFNTHEKNLPGKPDIFLPKFNLCVFVQGCFWHGHQCHLFKLPKTRRQFWRDKINQTILRDLEKTKELLLQKKRVLLVWECCTKGKKKLTEKAIRERLEEFCFSSHPLAELDSRGLQIPDIKNWLPILDADS